MEAALDGVRGRAGLDNAELISFCPMFAGFSGSRSASRGSRPEDCPPLGTSPALPSLQTDTEHIVPGTWGWQEVSPSLAAQPSCTAKTWGCHWKATCLPAEALGGAPLASPPQDWLASGSPGTTQCQAIALGPWFCFHNQAQEQRSNCFCLHKRKF